MPHVTYFWDEIEDNVVEEYDGDTGATIASFTTEPTMYGSVLSQDRSGEKHYFQFDGQGNTTELSSPTGNVTDVRRFSAFGPSTVSIGLTKTPWQWGGRWGYMSSVTLESIAIRRRSYADPGGRWLSVDPSLPSFGMSLYIFGDNRPSTTVDPTGLATISSYMDKSMCATPNKRCDILFFGAGVPEGGACRYRALNPGHIGYRLGAVAIFAPPDCNCCEYRQFVTTIRARLTITIPGEPIDVKIDTREGTGSHEDYSNDTPPCYFGRKDNLGLGPGCSTNWYLAGGCFYLAGDMPGFSNVLGILAKYLPNGVKGKITFELNQQFSHKIVDVCQGLDNPPTIREIKTSHKCTVVLDEEQRVVGNPVVNHEPPPPLPPPTSLLDSLTP